MIIEKNWYLQMNSRDIRKTYVGSALNLSRRFTTYYSIVLLNKLANKSIIYKALLKYGYSNFKLDILESHLYI